MSTIRVYQPSITESDIESIAYVRQNPWKKVKGDFLEYVQHSKILHLPHAHSKADVILYDTTRTISQPPAKRLAELPIGSVILVPNGTKGLLVRLTSDVQRGALDHMCVASNPKTCGHHHSHSTKDCVQCSNAIDSIFSPADTKELQSQLRQGHIIEPFWTLYRTCAIVGKADYNGTNGSSIAGMDSVGTWKRYWKLV